MGNLPFRDSKEPLSLVDTWARPGILLKRRIRKSKNGKACLIRRVWRLNALVIMFVIGGKVKV